jgi:hypothetical protein
MRKIIPKYKKILPNDISLSHVNNLGKVFDVNVSDVVVAALTLIKTKKFAYKILP